MEAFNIERSRTLLKSFAFEDLFIDELGWNQASSKKATNVTVDEINYTCQPIAELSGMIVFTVLAEDGQIPYSKKRKEIHQALSQSYHENLLIFIDDAPAHSVWYWVKRENGKTYPRTHHYDRWQDPDFHLNKISGLFVAMSELDPEGRIEITRVVQRVQGALDIERVTKRFYGEFQQVHEIFMVNLESSIPDEKDRRWYTSALLNRIMFIYFLQRQRLIDNENTNYLHEKLKDQDWQDRYYLNFLHPLFFEGFALHENNRSDQTKTVLGNIPYLNGGLFLHHPMEIKYQGQIHIPDQAFEDLYTLLDGYTWHLDDRPGKDSKEINPDVLGYIFEKYINQKAFGAYYTRPEITEYLCEQTIERLILEKMREVDKHDLGALPPLLYEDVHELLRKMDGQRALILLQQILPKLSLLDPACGSGAFLVAALKTLTGIYQSALGRADYLDHTALRQYLEQELKGHPNRNYYIRKKIVSYNLFGVDIMEEAVEIARLRLFLALVATLRPENELEPLPNIDFNILPGNSLIGLLRIDEDKFNSLSIGTGDGKMAQSSLFAFAGKQSYRQMVEEKERLVKNYRLANTLTDDVESLRLEIESHRRKAQSTLDQILLNEFVDLKIKYEQATWDINKNKLGRANKRSLILDDIATLHPFHWGYEFDEVMNTRGGFDAIITNPPWEIWKPQAKEFFADYAEVVTKNKMRIEEFQKKQKELLRNVEIREAWLDYLNRFPHQSAFFRKANQYKNQTAVVAGRKTGSDLNLYKLFTEQCNNLLRNRGLCGTVIPSGIYTDLGATGLRYMLFEQTELLGLFGFENRRSIFEGVDSRFKFAVLTFRKGGHTNTFPATFMQHDVEELNNFPHNTLEMSLPLIRRLSPEPLSLMEFDNPLDVQIAKKMLEFPLLGDKKWDISLSNGFHMTNQSYLFKNENTANRLPLFEGKMMHQFLHQWETSARYWIDEKEGRSALIGKNGKDDGQTLGYQNYQLGFRRIGRNTDERTMITTILPTYVFPAESLTLFTSDHTLSELLCLTSILNSFVLDFGLRQRVTANINMFYVYQLPVPRLTSQDLNFQPIRNRAAQLICTTSEFDRLAAEVGLGSHANGITDQTHRAQLRAELDGLIAHVYGLTEEEFQHILSTFPLVPEEVKEAALNEYRKLIPDPTLISLITTGETELVEFKVATCRNPHTGKYDNSMRHNITKAVAAFMNSNGGTLLIGVADDSSITGVDVEYATANSQKASWDGYELFLNDLLNKSLSIPAAFNYFTISRHAINGHDVAQIKVKPAPEPAYINNKLYVRAGAQSKELQGPDLIAYVNSHWEGN